MSFVFVAVFLICLYIANIMVDRNNSTYKDMINQEGKQIVTKYTMAINEDNVALKKLTDDVFHEYQLLVYQRYVSRDENKDYTQIHPQYHSKVTESTLGLNSMKPTSEGVFLDDNSEPELIKFYRSIFVDNAFYGYLELGFDTKEIFAFNRNVYLSIFLFYFLICAAVFYTFKKLHKTEKKVVIRRKSRYTTSRNPDLNKKIIYLSQFTQKKNLHKHDRSNTHVNKRYNVK